MKSIKNEKQSGFTIIEVLIVLAIAGLILLIVFLAVPALQRNSRNTQIRNDVASVLGMVAEYSSNSQGRLPASVCSNANGEIGMHSAAAGCDATTHKVGQVRPGTTVTASTADPTTLGAVNIALNRGCTAAGNALDATAKPRSVAALFRVETATGGTGIMQCQSS